MTAMLDVIVHKGIQSHLFCAEIHSKDKRLKGCALAVQVVNGIEGHVYKTMAVELAIHWRQWLDE